MQYLFASSSDGSKIGAKVLEDIPKSKAESEYKRRRSQRRALQLTKCRRS
jgi:hypothetical protein